jgi:hypothetical protein
VRRFNAWTGYIIFDEDEDVVVIELYGGKQLNVW